MFLSFRAQLISTALYVLSPVDIATWNIRGLNQASKQKEVKDFIKEEEIELFVALETHVRKKKVDIIAGKVFPNWEWHSNSLQSDRGCRLLLGWNQDKIKVMVITQSAQLCFVMWNALKVIIDSIVPSETGEDKKKIMGRFETT